jgi:hypothetical protein
MEAATIKALIVKANIVEDRIILIAGTLDRLSNLIANPDSKTLGAIIQYIKDAEQDATILRDAWEQYRNAVEEEQRENGCLETNIDTLALKIVDQFESRLAEVVGSQRSFQRAVAGELDEDRIAEIIGSNIDSSDIANHIEISASDIASELDLRDIVSELDMDDLAGRIDCSDIAQYIPAKDVAEHLDYKADELASKVDLSDVASELDYEELANIVRQRLDITPTDVARAMLKEDFDEIAQVASEDAALRKHLEDCMTRIIKPSDILTPDRVQEIGNAITTAVLHRIGDLAKCEA